MAKVVLITGGSSGIGKAIGEFLHDKGYNVYGTSRNPKNVSSAPSFKLVALDVTNSESIKNCIAEILRIENRIDVLINNAGVGITGAIEETPMIEIEKAFNTNVFGPIEITNAVLPTMRGQKSGHIINITSIAGYMGLPYRGIYSATKAALEITTEAYRMELKQFNVQMSTIAPGDFATNIAAGRFHSPLINNSPYYKQYKDTLKMMDEHVDAGMDPIKMAAAVYTIIENPSPKVHYKVGALMQKCSIVLKKVLPSKTYESLIMNHYKLK